MTPAQLKARRIERNQRGLDRPGFARQQQAFRAMRVKTRANAISQAHNHFIWSRYDKAREILAQLRQDQDLFHDREELDGLERLIGEHESGDLVMIEQPRPWLEGWLFWGAVTGVSVCAGVMVSWVMRAMP